MKHSVVKAMALALGQFAMRVLPPSKRSADVDLKSSRALSRAGAVRVPSANRFRVLFVIRPGLFNSGSTRYRGHNLIEALGLFNIEAAHLDDRCLPESVGEILAFDLIVIVRRDKCRELDQLLQLAEVHAIPVIFDLDDYLFDEEAIAHSEFLRLQPVAAVRSFIGQWRELIRSCGRYAGATPFLCDRAKPLAQTYHIPNGVNLAQIELSRIARLEADRAPSRDFVRLGYFSGTLTHQADFELICPVLVRLMEEFTSVHLTVVGDLHLENFRALLPFRERVEKRPLVDWRRLPSEIARVDINLIPLLINPFTEGKSELKYFEAALLKVPSVASPTEVFRRCIDHGVNGYLARTAEEWYESLRGLVSRRTLREKVGENAYERVTRQYVPTAIGSAARRVYVQVIDEQRTNLGVSKGTFTMTAVVQDLQRALRERSPVFPLCQALADQGVGVTLQFDPESSTASASRALAEIATSLGGQPRFTVQAGREILTGDILLATDGDSARRVCQASHRARWCACLLDDGGPSSLDALDIDLIVLDPDLAETIKPERRRRVLALPLWVEHRPARLDFSLDPSSILAIAAGSVHEQALRETLLALEQNMRTHEKVPCSLFGPWPAALLSRKLKRRFEPSLGNGVFGSHLESHPICVVVHGPGRPPWVYELLAKGCPVICVSSHFTASAAELELKRGIIQVPGDRHSIADAIGSLLVNRPRLTRNVIEGGRFVGSLPSPGAAAQALIREFQSRAEPALGLHHAALAPDGENPTLDAA